MVRPVNLSNLIAHKDFYVISKFLGQCEKITTSEAKIVDSMDGFLTLEQIALFCDTDYSTVEQLYLRLKSGQYVTELSKWNIVKWCDHCDGYLLTEEMTCDHCNGLLTQVPLEPPCDVWILFETEFNFIRSVIHDKCGLLLPKNSVLLGNWCLKDNKTFWEIVYQGSIILRVYFNGDKRDMWKYVISNDISEKKFDREKESFNQQIDRYIRLNEKRLKVVEEQSQALIASTFGIYESLPLVYFSGGKESMIIANIFKKMKIECNLIFAILGCDQPDDIDFYKKQIEPHLRRIDFFHSYYFENSSDVFFDLAKQKGKLGANDPWCRNEIKMPLKHKATRAVYNDNHFVAYEGSRKYETSYRRRYSPVNVPDNYSNQIWVHPLSHWTGLDVWLYTFQQKIPINPVYFKGFQRTTCWCCPLVQPYHTERSRELYKDLWAQLSTFEMVGFKDKETNDVPY